MHSIFELKDVSRLYVYQYTFIDDQSFIRSPSDVQELASSPEELAALVAAVGELFKSKGWEGDGEIGVIWLPPFLRSHSDTMGDHLWHVKQSNNGVSWIGSLLELDYPGIEEQNQPRR